MILVESFAVPWLFLTTTVYNPSCSYDGLKNTELPLKNNSKLLISSCVSSTPSLYQTFSPRSGYGLPLTKKVRALADPPFSNVNSEFDSVTPGLPKN